MIYNFCIRKNDGLYGCLDLKLDCKGNMYYPALIYKMFGNYFICTC